ncbi:MAG: hypothetical protein QXI93_02215 [Candidatus Methanomethylicia archaeon]
MYTTHVGSFPLEYSEENVLKVFHDMIEIGIDYPPYPQLRDFITIFLKPLIENNILKEEGKKLILHKQLQEGFPPPSIDHVIYEAEKIADELKRDENLKFMTIRGCITGPFTLSSQIQLTSKDYGLTNSLLKNKDLVLKHMVKLVRSYANYLHDKLKFKFIVIDEPILSIMVGAKKIMFEYTIEDIIKALDTILNEINFTGIHVCGIIPAILKEILLNTKCIKVLDDEFKDTPRNFNVYSKEDLERNDKYISLGCVSSKNITIESEEEIMKIVNEGINRFGSRLLMIKPDCGFRTLLDISRDPNKAYEIAIEKLRRIVNVSNMLKSII